MLFERFASPLRQGVELSEQHVVRPLEVEAGLALLAFGQLRRNCRLQGGIEIEREQAVGQTNVEVVDAGGHRCPTDEARIDFDLTGPAIWRGGYNSGIVDSTNNRYLSTECGINRIAIRSTTTPGTITLTARREGLVSGTLELRSLPKQDELTSTPQ
jgi:hypothetical protein